MKKCENELRVQRQYELGRGEWLRVELQVKWGVNVPPTQAQCAWPPERVDARGRLAEAQLEYFVKNKRMTAKRMRRESANVLKAMGRTNV